ncbi:MAG: hypothetical protein ABIL27_02660 [candidate division WOR-3 bacterium]
MKENITQEDIEKNKLVAALSYLWILFILYWLVDSQFVKFHAKQSLVIFGGDIVLFVAGFVLENLIPMWGFISWLLRLGLFALRVIGFIYAITGNVKEVPIVGSIAESINI